MSQTKERNKRVVHVSEALKQDLQVVHAHEQKGQLSQAFQVCNELLQKYPENSVLLHYLGMLSLRTGQISPAITYFDRAVKASPDQVSSYHFLGVAYCQNRQIEEGIEAYRQALALEPTFPEAHYNLGIALVEKDESAEAKEHFEMALKANLVTPELYYNLGYLAHIEKNITDSIAFYRKALQINPHYKKCLANLGEALMENYAFEEAKEIFEKLATLESNAFVSDKLAVLYLALKENQKARDILLKIDKKREEDYYILSSTYINEHDTQKGIEVLQEALEHYPENLTFLLTYIYCQRILCIWKDQPALMEKLMTLLNNDDYLFKYAQYYIFGFTFEQELQFARKIASYYEMKVKKFFNLEEFSQYRPMNRKLKIGYLSANVKSHANAYTIVDLFRNHNTQNFEIYLYSVNKPDSSAVAKELMSSAPHFVDLSGGEFSEQVKKIYYDDIDILIDLTGYHNPLSSCLLALKLAKVQIGYMGHCGTRGADFIDYILIDRTVVTKEDIQYFDEKLIFLPDTFFITSDKYGPLAVTKKDFNLPEDKLILGCFNYPTKYDPKCFDVWMKILAKLPNAVLCLLVNKNNAVATERNLLDHAAEYGLQDRLYFTYEISKENHLGRLKLFDLFLDSFECTAQSTAIDALSVGLPIITLYGYNIASRGASSILKAIGMSKLITYSVEEYIEKAVYYSTHPDELKALHQEILENKTKEPLFNCNLLVKNLENAYRRVQEQYDNHAKEDIFM